MLKLLVLSAIVGAVVCPPTKRPSIDNNSLHAKYRLTNETFPTFYDLRLILDPNKPESFSGSVSIRIIPIVDIEEIVLHSMAMTLNNIRITTDFLSTDNLYADHRMGPHDTHFVRIQLSDVIPAFHAHIVHVDFVGRYDKNMFGLYITSYETSDGVVKRLVASQLQPTFARRAFPCYDEPNMKAVFRVTIYAPSQFTCIRSNMPERNFGEPNWPDIAGYIRHEFKDTPMMSTYSVAFLVSEFEYIDNSANPIYDRPFRIYSRPDTKQTAKFALEFGQQFMVALENYLLFPYYFPKMDKVAVPNFAGGATENWGLGIYREGSLLLQSGVSTTAKEQEVGKSIGYESTHQWFGNEVSPRSWDYTWLNQGFAHFFESFITDMIRPEWRMMDQYVIDVQDMFQSDAVPSAKPMTFPVYTPSQILSSFNAVSYQKAGCVIRMIMHAVTPKVFRRGLVLYIKNNARGVVAPEDLYTALQQAVDESDHPFPYGYNVVNVLTTWATQGGYPLITVRRSASHPDSLIISQKRFLNDPNMAADERWRVPVNWILSTNTECSDTSPQAWIPHTLPAVAIDVPKLSEAEWFIFNKQQSGYYRVQYDLANWQALVRVLNISHDTIHVLNRAQLIDDAFNLARTNRLGYTIPLDMAGYLVFESDYIPWVCANEAFVFLETVLSESPAYGLFQNFLLDLSRPLLVTLGFYAHVGEAHVTAFHRNIILNLNCRNGNKICKQFSESLLHSGQVLHPDIQMTVFCSGLRTGNPNTFNILWNLYLGTSDYSQQAVLLNALGCTSNKERLQFYLNQVILETTEVKDHDRHTILLSVINAGPQNLDIALQFTLQNFLEIQKRVQSLKGTTAILKAFSKTLTKRKHQDAIVELETRYKTYFTFGERAAVAGIKENLAASVSWSERHLIEVSTWLMRHYTKHSVRPIARLQLLVLPLLLLL